MVNNENNRVNIKARIDRHLRIVKQNNWIKTNVLTEKRYWTTIYLVLIFVVFVFPMYPSLASFVYNNTTYDFYREGIDETSIIESYYWWDIQEWDSEYWLPIIESQDSFLSVNTILNDNRDLAWTNEILEYEIKPWDSFSSIAYDFSVSTSSILWANDFEKNHVLRPGEIIKVPPVSWIIHKVVAGDTISSIAKKYDIWESKIKEQNLLTDNSSIKIWDSLVIPWAIKKVIVPVYVTPTKIATSTKKPAKIVSWWYNFAKEEANEVVSSVWTHKLVRRAPSHSFVWWNCTRYVAQYKNVYWWGNANQWLANARSAWAATWSSPKLWAIVQLTWTWYNPRYWHVWIVMEIKSDYIIISDMNYRRLNEITYRKIGINDRSIDWYIYVD